MGEQQADARRAVTVHLTPADVELLHQLGEGDLDQGVEWALTVTRAVLQRIRGGSWKPLQVPLLARVR